MTEKPASAGAMAAAHKFAVEQMAGYDTQQVDALAALLDSFARSARLEEARWWRLLLPANEFRRFRKRIDAHYAELEKAVQS